MLLLPALLGLVVAGAPPVAPVARVAVSGVLSEFAAGFIVVDGPTSATTTTTILDAELGVAVGEWTFAARDSFAHVPLNRIFNPEAAAGDLHVADVLLHARWTPQRSARLTPELDVGVLVPTSYVSRTVQSFGGVAAQARLLWSSDALSTWGAIGVADQPFGSDGTEAGRIFYATPTFIPPFPGVGTHVGLACDPTSSDELFRFACMADPRLRGSAVLGGALALADGLLAFEIVATLDVIYWPSSGNVTDQLLGRDREHALLSVHPLANRRALFIAAGVVRNGVPYESAVIAGVAQLGVGL